MDTKHKPPIAVELESIVGRAGLEAIIRVSRGVPLYVPKCATKGHSLESLLDEKCFRALCRAYGGERIMVPMMAAQRRHVRNAAIAAARKAGQSTRQTVREFGVSWRTAQRANARAKEAEQKGTCPTKPRQPTLWERGG
ncbi:MAG: hypothetical protein LBM75_09305 [Myxococcales bacterium]|jgi:hypothetical protein|nr:hypothetical protein [Myxococcales bacterium]